MSPLNSSDSMLDSLLFLKFSQVRFASPQRRPIQSTLAGWTPDLEK